MSDPSPGVLVVGAGPTGLLLAAELERRDVPCLLIDALDAPRGWDRATVVHPRSLEIFEALGIVDRFLAEGVRTRAARFHSDGELLGELNLELTGSRYGFDLGLSEEVTESVLTDFLEAQGGAVTRSTRLVRLVAGEDAATATLERDGERREVVVRWVVGCDGLRSAVREAVGIEFPGTDIDAQWAVFDATIEGWNDDYDVASVHLDRPPVILTPLPGRRWRVYLRPTAATSDLVAEAGGVIGRYAPGATFADVENPTRFRCHSRVAARFRSGRVLLAGDAAHACTPAEGHGMNTGLQDAFNLGWKLALVCGGEAGAGLLDTYEVERRPVAERIVSSGADVERAQTMTEAGERATRDSSIRRTFADLDAAHHEAVAAAELDRSYPSSRAVAGDDGSELAPGRRLSDTRPVEPADGDPRPLHELTHRRGYTLIVVGGPQADPGRVGDLVTELEGHAGSPAVAAVVGLCPRPCGPPVGRIDESVAAQLGVVGVTVLAVRPDRYIGFRDDSGNPKAVAAYLNALVA
ncbi:MAG TPA: FAD-dependent monooxygenase [Thermoleophilaceae bacterium]|nr:FAD-dependent monooxygenase [Thermoleophilaceae bacterium]